MGLYAPNRVCTIIQDPASGLVLSHLQALAWLKSDFSFVLAYGLGFGLAGLGLGIVAPKITRGYILLVLFGIAASYACWRFALATPSADFAAAAIWGLLNQLGLNALMVSLNRRATQARGAVMGLNSAVTYSAVFAGPVVMGPVYAGSGFSAVSVFAAVLVVAGAVVSWKAI